MLDHERLEVYQLGIEFVASANDFIERLPRGRGYLADQLQRAALSIVLNTAEGAGKFSPQDKSQFYTRARGSATESAAVLDVCFKLALISEAEWSAKKTVIKRVVEMLTKLIKTHQQHDVNDRG
jgi:four helix bundle protein